MIKANELRQGNLFLGMGMIQTVLEIIDNTDRGRINQYGYEVLIVPKENKNQYKPIEIEGINITEEWLMKNKIEPSHKIGFRRFYQLGNLSFEICDDNRTAIYFKLELLCFLNYVHEFQNLYFALSSEEFIIIP